MSVQGGGKLAANPELMDLTNSLPKETGPLPPLTGGRGIFLLPLRNRYSALGLENEECE